MKYLSLLMVCIAFFLIGVSFTNQFECNKPVPDTRWAFLFCATFWWLFLLNYYYTRKR